MLDFTNLKNELIEYNKKIKKYDSLTSYLRLLVFIMIVIFFCLSFKNNIFCVLMILSIVLFIIFIFIHITIKSKMNHKLETIYEYEKRINKEIQALDKGLYVNDSLSNDLGLFNDNSLFQLINIARTSEGKNKLKDYFLNGNKEKIKASKLVNKLNDFNFHLEFNEVLKNNVTNSVNPKINNTKLNKIFVLINILINISIFVSFGLFLGGLIKVYYPIMLLLINIMMVKINVKNIDVSKISIITKNFNEYFKIASFLKEYKIDDEYYKELTNFNLDYINKNKKLDIVASFRSNELLSFLFNGLFSIDLIVAGIYNKIKLDNKVLDDIKNKVAIIEALTSLSVIPLIHDISCIPEYSDTLAIKDMYHPMLKNPVLNDFSLKSNQILITGSNMSGKTTFLRGIAINIILANAGGMCLAKEFKLNEYKVKTSMIIKDDLYNGISTFQAELNKLKEIIDSIKGNDNYIIFIDELFRGTNQIDRIKGAKYLIEYLNKKNIVLFLSTHDSELFNLNLDIYHFEEYYDDLNIKFDYKLKNGPATTTNAIKLMSMIGLDIKWQI